MNTVLAQYVKRKFLTIAEDLVDNPQGLRFKLDSVKEKLTKKHAKDVLGHYFEDLKTLLRMIRLWTARRYTNVSRQTIVYSILALVYFVTPTDFVPDFLLGLGYVDDLAVIGWVLGKIQVELEEFKKWENSNE